MLHGFQLVFSYKFERFFKVGFGGGSALDMVEAAGRTRIEPAGSLFEAP